MSTEPTGESAVFADDSLDSLFGVLANARRRDALAYLGETDGAASLDELADAIAARAQTGRAGDAGENVAISLHHQHLPKLERAGLTERTDGEVSLTDRGRDALETMVVGVTDTTDT